MILSIRDDRFFELLTNVVARFTSITRKFGPGLLGEEQKVILALIEMEDFRCHLGKERLALILQSLIIHFEDEKIRTIISALRNPTPDNSRSSMEALPSNQDGAGQIITAFQLLVKKLSSSSVPIFLSVFFE